MTTTPDLPDLVVTALDALRTATVALRRIHEQVIPLVDVPTSDETPLDGLRCVCGDPVQWMDAPDGPGWIHTPGSDTPCLDARPRCPQCGMPHDLTPGSLPMAVCARVRARIVAGEFPPRQTDAEAQMCDEARAPDHPEPASACGEECAEGHVYTGRCTAGRLAGCDAPHPEQRWALCTYDDGHDGDHSWADVQPDAWQYLAEPDNPAAWALARHIADHPMSTVQAAFRYLNSPIILELHEVPDIPADNSGPTIANPQAKGDARAAQCDAETVSRVTILADRWQDRPDRQDAYEELTDAIFIATHGPGLDVCIDDEPCPICAARTAPDNPAASDDDLREEYAAVIRRWWDDDDQGAAEIATAVLAVRDRRMEQLTAELAALREVARGYCPACGRGDAAPTVEDWEQQRERAIQLESEVATYRRAVADWVIGDGGLYVPLRALAAIATAAGVAVPEQWEMHYQRVERLEAEVRRLHAERTRWQSIAQQQTELTQRAEQARDHAKATIARVREVADQWKRNGGPGATREAGRLILATIKSPADDGPAS